MPGKLGFRIYKAEKPGHLIMTNKTYYFNIDVDTAKQKFDVSFSDQRVASFENNVAGFKLLLKEIKN